VAILTHSALKSACVSVGATLAKILLTTCVLLLVKGGISLSVTRVHPSTLPSGW
jgi:hypothetical protein